MIVHAIVCYQEYLTTDFRIPTMPGRHRDHVPGFRRLRLAFHNDDARCTFITPALLTPTPICHRFIGIPIHQYTTLHTQRAPLYPLS